ncbi:phosphatase PAP2 family protein [Fulvivirga ligni]|uniref:phosphatase PAP2 family protein n=1 Tax=Fulvivirga ligni TaxID=2904246 RepID=UPI001F3A357B|nr:phosphatase PAP2 family protein [Fulvivirga ligni]UII20423.1 phosphatase PAP2 family protein [Fulvivirga ligni]
MIEWLIKIDEQLFFFLNGLHQDWLDQIMFWISDKYVWFPFYAILAGFIIKKYKWRAIIWLVGLGLAIGAADYICSGVMKPYFARYRPSRNPDFDGMVYIINEYTGGKYGFASSHSGNAFALASFIFFLFKNEYKWAWLFFLWAAIVAYSRIYLGVHYPGDITIGGLIGLSSGYLFHKLANWVDKNKFKSAQT